MQEDRHEEQRMKNLRMISSEDPTELLAYLRGIEPMSLLSIFRGDSDVLLRNLEARCASLLSGDLGDLGIEQSSSVREIIDYVQKLRATIDLVVDLATSYREKPESHQATGTESSE